MTHVIVLCSFEVMIVLGKERASSPTRRIANGSEITTERAPYQVLINFKAPRSEHICGGTIISSRWILTAAHCVDLDEYGIREGDVKIYHSADDFTSFGKVLLHTRRIFLHPRYMEENLAYDIALIWLENFSQIKYDNRVARARLPRKSEDSTSCQAYISGYGYSHSDVWDGQLRQTVVTLTHPNDCSYHSYEFDHKTMICVNERTGICAGDSGSPMTTMESSPLDRAVIGIVSAAGDCNLSEYPQFYTRVSYYIPWINETIKRSTSV